MQSEQTENRRVDWYSKTCFFYLNHLWCLCQWISHSYSFIQTQRDICRKRRCPLSMKLSAAPQAELSWKVNLSNYVEGEEHFLFCHRLRQALSFKTDWFVVWSLNFWPLRTYPRVWQWGIHTTGGGTHVWWTTFYVLTYSRPIQCFLLIKLILFSYLVYKKCTLSLAAT